MLHKAGSSIEEVPYCFSRSYVKLQGHTAKKIVDFYPNWAFPDCNSRLNSPMAMKCCTKLETAKERCPVVFQGHPSNFKVTRYKTSPIFTQIGRFRTIGRSQLSNPSDLPCFSCVNFFDRWPLKNKANLIDLIAVTGLVILVKLDLNRRFFSKTRGHLFYATSSFLHNFVAIGEFTVELQSGKAQFGSKYMYNSVWPWINTSEIFKANLAKKSL